MKRALILSFGEFYPFLGGIARYVDDVVCALKDSHKITVLAPRYPQFSDEELKYPLNKVHVIRPKITRFSIVKKVLGNVYSMWQYVDLQPDVVIITHPEALSLSRWVMPLMRKTQIIYIMYGTEILEMQESSQRNQYISDMKRMTQIVTISEYTNELLQTHFPMIENTTIIQPCVSKSFIDARSSVEYVKKFNLSKNSYILSVGRLVKRKGHILVLQQLRELLIKHPKMKYVIAGTGPEKDDLQTYVRTHDLENVVVFTGRVSENEKKSLMEHALFLIQPSFEDATSNQRVEGFGITIVESLTMGTPAIIQAHGGMTEIIVNRMNGYVIHMTEPNALLEIISNATKNTSSYEKMRSEAKKSAKLYTLDVFTKKLSALLS